MKKKCLAVGFGAEMFFLPIASSCNIISIRQGWIDRERAALQKLRIEKACSNVLRQNFSQLREILRDPVSWVEEGCPGIEGEKISHLQWSLPLIHQELRVPRKDLKGDLKDLLESQFCAIVRAVDLIRPESISIEVGSLDVLSVVMSWGLLKSQLSYYDYAVENIPYLNEEVGVPIQGQGAIVLAHHVDLDFPKIVQHKASWLDLLFDRIENMELKTPNENTRKAIESDINRDRPHLIRGFNYQKKEVRVFPPDRSLRVIKLADELNGSSLALRLGKTALSLYWPGEKRVRFLRSPEILALKHLRLISPDRERATREAQATLAFLAIPAPVSRHILKFLGFDIDERYSSLAA